MSDRPPKPPASASALSKLKLDCRSVHSMRSRRRVVSSGLSFVDSFERARARRVAGAHVEERPGRPASVGGLISKQALKSREHERRLATAGAADDRDEAAILHEAVERKGLPLAPKEEAAVAEEERTQARKGPLVGKPRPVIWRKRRGGRGGRGFTQRRLVSRRSLISIALTVWSLAPG
jgi:hypothetical protein